GARRNLYPVITAPTETAFAERVELVKRADKCARAYDPRIFQVQASYADNLRHIMIATSEGVLNFDRQPMARLNVRALARENGGGELCTVVDDGAIRGRRGSLNLDDEGAVTQRNVLIENGILRGYLQDKLSSRIMRSQQTGSGRRESYGHIPMPRMTNTFMLA